MNVQFDADTWQFLGCTKYNVMLSKAEKITEDKKKASSRKKPSSAYKSTTNNLLGN